MRNRIVAYIFATKWFHYLLMMDKMKKIDQWLEQLQKIWASRFNQLDEVLTTIKKKKK